MSTLYIGVMDPTKIIPDTKGRKIRGCTTFKAVNIEETKKIAEEKNFISFAEIKQVWLQGIDYGK